VVTLSVIVDQQGRARDIRVVRSVGMGLDEKAIDAVKRWRFSPGMKDGIPVAVQVNVEVSFRLY
jgi:TonB family protein